MIKTMGGESSHVKSEGIETAFPMYITVPVVVDIIQGN